MLASLALAACGQKQAAAPAAVTVNALMQTRLDPAADALWESVGTIFTVGHAEVREPKTEADWSELRRQARQLIDGAELLKTPRPLTAPGTPLLDAGEPGARTVQQIEADIRRDQAGFAQRAAKLQAVGREMVAIIDARDAAALFDKGERLDEACEACHVAYWYPSQAAQAPRAN